MRDKRTRRTYSHRLLWNLSLTFLSRKTVIWMVYCRGIEHKLIIKNAPWISVRIDVQLLSCVQLFATPWTAPGFPVLHYFLEFAQTHVCWVSDNIQTSHPVFPFSSCLWSLPASESFPMSWLFSSGGQSTGASASASVLPMNIQGWFPLGLTGLISLQSKTLSGTKTLPLKAKPSAGSGVPRNIERGHHFLRTDLSPGT